MKRFLIVLVFVATGLVANAQFFVGGSIGFSHGAGYSEETSTLHTGMDPVPNETYSYSPRTTTFSIAPTVGMMFSDNMGFGATIGYKQDITKECTNDEKKEFNSIIGYSEFAFTPFFRYVFGDFGKIKLYADAKIPLAFGNNKHVYEKVVGEELVEEKGTSEYPKIFEFGFYIQPAFTYQFNEHISFNAQLGLLTLGWKQTKESYVEEDAVIKNTKEGVDKNNEFGFGINGRVPVEFGFVYTF